MGKRVYSEIRAQAMKYFESMFNSNVVRYEIPFVFWDSCLEVFSEDFQRMEKILTQSVVEGASFHTKENDSFVTVSVKLPDGEVYPIRFHLYEMDHGKVRTDDLLKEQISKNVARAFETELPRRLASHIHAKTTAIGEDTMWYHTHQYCLKFEKSPAYKAILKAFRQVETEARDSLEKKARAKEIGRVRRQLRSKMKSALDLGFSTDEILRLLNETVVASVLKS